MEAGHGETEADIKWFSGKPSNPSLPNDDSGLDQTDKALPPPIKFKKSDMYYDMTGKKHLIIFNHRKYEKTMYFNFQRPAERKGTENDVKSLCNTFDNLGFQITVYDDLRHADIIDKMDKVCNEDHRATSCIAVVILTHGEDGSVYAAERPYRLSDVTTILQHSDAGLVGKPKLVFVQACRGESMDDGRRAATDGGESIVLPTHSDMLITFSSAEKHLAYRETNGSWLMQSLCQVLDEHHQNHDLLQLITFVNQNVAYRATFTYSTVTSNKKMMPETKFTLTKLLHF